MTDDTQAMPQQPPGIPGSQGIPGLTAPRQPYSHGRRAAYGVLWAGWTAVLLIAGFSGLFGGQILGGLLALVLAGLAGRYDYRIWTWQARRLLFFIIW